MLKYLMLKSQKSAPFLSAAAIFGIDFLSEKTFYLEYFIHIRTKNFLIWYTKSKYSILKVEKWHL